MNLHTAGQKPDWYKQPSNQLNRWQAVAVATRGILTPANAVSIVGFFIVVYGSILLFEQNQLLGITLIALGRLFDLADGLVAEITKTKSHVGEIVDTTVDKAGIFIVAITAYTAGILPANLLAILMSHHIFMVLFSILFSRRYQIHPTKLGKYAMFVSWVAIIAATLSSLNSIKWLDVLANTSIILYGILAIFAIIGYYFVLQRKIIDRLRAASWTRQLGAIIYVSNPNSSNNKRAYKWVTRLSGHLHRPYETVKIDQISTKLIKEIAAKHQTRKKILLAIGGGDGSVGSVVNVLMNNFSAQQLKNIYVLPLWGGNGNDYAYMLNGLTSTMTPKRLLAESGPVEVPVLEVSLTTSNKKARAKKTKTMYAASYASFGASAYATKQLEKKRLASRPFLQHFGLLIVLRELMSVVRSVKNAPTFKAETGESKRETNLFEHSFINGSRIAKVNRVPLKLTDNAFFHASVNQKHPLVIIEVARVITKRNHEQYVKKESVKFIVKESVNAQVDGEIVPLQKNTTVVVGLANKKISCISARLI